MKIFFSIAFLILSASFAMSKDNTPKIDIVWIKNKKASTKLLGDKTIVELPEEVRDLINSKFPGYRIPDQREFKKGSDWVVFFEKGEINAPFIAIADFNGDKSQDIALRVVSTKKVNNWKLIIFNSKQNKYIAHVLSTSPESKKTHPQYGRNYGSINKYGIKAKKCGKHFCLDSWVYESASFQFEWKNGKYVKKLLTD